MMQSLQACAILVVALSTARGQVIGNETVVEDTVVNPTNCVGCRDSGPPIRTLTASIGGAELAIKYYDQEAHEADLSHLPLHTGLTTDGELDIGGLAVPKGHYTLYIETKDPSGPSFKPRLSTQWKLVINNVSGDSFGEYDSSKDLGKVNLKIKKAADKNEELMKSALRDMQEDMKRLTTAGEFRYQIVKTGDKEGLIVFVFNAEVATVPFTVIHGYLDKEQDEK